MSDFGSTGSAGSSREDGARPPTTYYERLSVVARLGAPVALGTLTANESDRQSAASALVVLAYSVQVGTAAALIIDTRIGRPIANRLDEVAALVMREFIAQHHIAFTDVRWLFRDANAVWAPLLTHGMDSLGGTQRVLLKMGGPLGGEGALTQAYIAINDNAVAISPAFQSMLALALQEIDRQCQG